MDIKGYNVVQVEGYLWINRKVLMDKEKDKRKDMSRDIKGYLWISQDKMGYVGQ